MSEPKPLASLSAGLLARKGDARPAMRRAYMPMTSVAPLPVALQSEAAHEELHDDLGWNDMGDDVHVAAPAAPTPVVVQQQERISQSFAQPAKKAVKERAPSRKAKAAFTLRLDPERHLRLRLACAIGNCSAQQIVTQALDRFLESQPGLDALVAQAPNSGVQN